MELINEPTIKLTVEELHTLEDFFGVCDDLSLSPNDYYNLLKYIYDIVSVGENKFCSNEGNEIKIIVL